jgi:hypothetical protein
MSITESDPEHRAPTQASIYVPRPDGTYGQGCALRPRGSPGSVVGSISWTEHEQAWREYARQFGSGQSAERLAQRGGFDWFELLMLLGHEPVSWKPNQQ